MSRQRTRKLRTLADYVGIAISPALIVGMVLSLTLFLLQVIYKGEFEGGFRWVLFWYVIASVLITRISIEQGSETASVFGTALGIATGLVTMVFAPETKSGINSVIVVWGLMVLIWWCSNKLTWDCTLIDDSQDASGEGLLQAAGLHHIDDDDQGEPANPELQREPTTRDVGIPFWKRFLFNRAARADKPHSPGMWIVYVALVGLPVMGVCQRWLKRDEQSLGFGLLFAFVASAMGLLLTTSFLGLRRYLRQRNLQMPGTVTRSWLVTGTVVLLGILVGALLVPRPGASYSLDAVVKRSLVTDSTDELVAAVADPGLEIDGPSDNSTITERRRDQLANNDGLQDGRGQRRGPQEDGSWNGGSQQPGSQQPGFQQPGFQQLGPKRPNSKRTDSKRTDSKRADSKRADSKQAGSKQADSKQAGSKGNGSSGGGTPPPPPSAPSSGLLDSLSFGGATLVLVMQVVSYLLFGLFVLYMLFQHGRALWRALLELWAALKGIFRRRGSRDGEDGSEETPDKVTAFAAYSNPFSDGTVLRASPAEMVCLTFEALEAWAREVGQGRLPDQTPREFADGLSKVHQREAAPIRRLASDYSRIAYGNRPPADEWREALDRLWSWMILSHRSRQQRAPAAEVDDE